MLPDYIRPTVKPECRALGPYELTNRPNLGLQQPRKPHYGGPVYLLMDSGSFSTSVEFAAHLWSARRATLIGSNPDGSYWSNDSGITPTIALPNSGLRLDVPLTGYFHELAGDLPADGAIPPDVPVPYTVAERIAGEDKEMRVALEMARQGRRAARVR
jgi:C-terminal processing protease CtpA/Prc